jgi:hypothetical protein
MCSQRVLDNSHSFGNLEDVMHITLFRKTRRHVDTIERFYVYKETKNKNKLKKNSDNTEKLCSACLKVVFLQQAA